MPAALNHPMQTNIIWKGLYYHCMENCVVASSDIGNEITSAIIGYHDRQAFQVDYHIRTGKNWEIDFASIRARLNEAIDTTVLEMKNGECFLNGKKNKTIKGFVFIDISLTPFTNTLPINRLQLQSAKRQVIQVIYFDILEKEIKPVKQVYTRLSKNSYLYENYDRSFSATIKTNEQGFVTNYPRLFKMMSYASWRLA
jgi:uncharacterized protein